MSTLITSPSNPLIKQARALRQKKARQESGLFLVEGILHVGEAAEAGWEIDTLLYCPERLRSGFGQALTEKLAGQGVRVVAVSEAAFETFAEKENPQGIAALVRERHLTLGEFPPFRLAAALVAPQDPGNIGSIFRTLDAVGADGLFLLEGGADPYQPACVRASMGTLFWKPFVQTSFRAFTEWSKQGGFRLVGTSAHASTRLHTFHRDQRPTILLLGSEQKGLSAEQMAACDELLSLPMRGRASSLNLAVAAGIFLYGLYGQSD
ncbi:MAG: RNA methyltransferase [Anaerolineales bacterium]|nr:RNA methyltransferase [Anaerolineales bacterium]MDW8276461.1 RNA methyltransferase [Anaerolineales bacterium]